MLLLLLFKSRQMGRLYRTEWFCHKECLTAFPEFVLPRRWSGLNRISHPDWLKLCVELNYAPNKNTKIPSAIEMLEEYQESFWQIVNLRVHYGCLCLDGMFSWGCYKQETQYTGKARGLRTHVLQLAVKRKRCVSPVKVCQGNWERISLWQQEVSLFLDMCRFGFLSEACYFCFYLFHFVFILFFHVMFFISYLIPTTAKLTCMIDSIPEKE